MHYSLRFTSPDSFAPPSSRSHQPVEIYGKEQVEGLTVKDLQTGAPRRLEVQGVFIEIGLFPHLIENEHSRSLEGT